MGNLFKTPNEKVKKEIISLREYAKRWGKPTSYFSLKDGQQNDLSEDPWVKNTFEKYFQTVYDYKDGLKRDYYGHDGLINLFKEAEQRDQYMIYNDPWEVTWSGNKVTIKWVAEIVYPTGGRGPSECISFDVKSEFEISQGIWLKNHFKEGVSAQTIQKKVDHDRKANMQILVPGGFDRNITPAIDVECTLCIHSFGTSNILCPHKKYDDVLNSNKLN